MPGIILYNNEYYKYLDVLNSLPTRIVPTLRERGILDEAFQSNLFQKGHRHNDIFDAIYLPIEEQKEVQQATHTVPFIDQANDAFAKIHNNIPASSSDTEYCHQFFIEAAKNSPYLSALINNYPYPNQNFQNFMINPVFSDESEKLTNLLIEFTKEHELPFSSLIKNKIALFSEVQNKYNHNPIKLSKNATPAQKITFHIQKTVMLIHAMKETNTTYEEGVTPEKSVNNLIRELLMFADDAYNKEQLSEEAVIALLKLGEWIKSPSLITMIYKKSLATGQATTEDLYRYFMQKFDRLIVYGNSDKPQNISPASSEEHLNKALHNTPLPPEEMSRSASSNDTTEITHKIKAQVDLLKGESHSTSEITDNDDTLQNISPASSEEHLNKALNNKPLPPEEVSRSASSNDTTGITKNFKDKLTGQSHSTSTKNESCFTTEETKLINARILELQKWARFSPRKQLKIKALEAMLRLAKEDLSQKSDIINKIKQKYPDVTAGRNSKTAKLLTDLEQSLSDGDTAQGRISNSKQ